MAAAQASRWFSQLAQGVIVADVDGRILSVNRAAAEIHGAAHVDVLPQDYTSTYGLFTVDGAPFPAADLPLTRAVRGETVAEARWRIRRPDGVMVLAVGSASPLLDDDGRQVGAILTLRDDTARDIAETELRRVNKDLQAEVHERTAALNRAWTLSTDFLAILDFEGRFQAFNPTWTRMLGYDETALYITPLSDLVQADDRAYAISKFNEGKHSATSVNFTNRLLSLNGRAFTVQWTLVAEADRVYAAGRDATLEVQSAAELDEAHAALRQAQKMEAIGQLTGGVAHDFNNFLTVIRSSADLLSRRDLEEDRRRRYIDAIRDTADRAAELTSQLLAFARQQPLRTQVFNLGERAERLNAMIQTVVGARVRVEMKFDCEPCIVETDVTQYETALINMAVNARDAMDGVGRLTLELEAVEAIPATRAQPALPGRFAAISLTDTGRGIAPDQLDKIFEPFFTTKEVGKGTGLGLSQVYGFAKQSLGDVRVESRQGEGSRFTLYIPRTSKSLPEPVVQDHAVTKSDRPQNILFVEDNQEIGGFGSQLLMELGYEVDWVQNADQALVRLAEAPGAFDVLFTDVIMPGAMNGLDLARRVRELWPAMPVILTTGYSEALATSQDQGFPLLRKPYSVEALSHVIRKVQRPQA